MARPIKDNADYFTHDADMRDDPKIKALRRKYKVSGYGIWCMLLEAITDSDNFRLKVDLDIIAGDFDVEPDFLQQVIQYCIQLDLLQTDEGCKMIWSKTLDNRFESLLTKRKRDRGELSPAKTNQSIVIASESTQSRVKKSKEEKSKVHIPFEGVVLDSWNEWIQFRKEAGKKMTPSTVKKQIQFLGGRAGPEIIAIINQSITNGWAGLFEPKQQNNGIRNTTQGTPIATTAIIEPGKDFGVSKGFSRSGSNGGGNGTGTKGGT